MAAPDWVTLIPSVPYKNLHEAMAIEQSHVPVIGTEVEDGPDLMRQQSNTILKKMPWRQLITYAQFATLDNFVLVTLAQGTKHFTMPVNWNYGSLQTCRVFLENGELSSQASGVHVAVSAMLKVYPPGFSLD